MTEVKNRKGSKGSAGEGDRRDRGVKESGPSIPSPGFGIPAEHYQQVPRPNPTKGSGKRGGGKSEKDGE